MNDLAAPFDGGEDDLDHNCSSNPTFDSVVQSRLSRRDVLSGAAGAAALAMVGGLKTGTALADQPEVAADLFGQRGLRLGFNPVAKSVEDVVTVPDGYSYDVLYALGDPIADGVPTIATTARTTRPASPIAPATTTTPSSTSVSARTASYNPHGSDRGLLCMNHEAITPAFLHPAGPTIVGGVRTGADEVLKEFYVHGVSVIESASRSAAWSAHASRPLQTQWDYVQARPSIGASIH